MDAVCLDFIYADEIETGSCKNTTTPFNALENMGDEAATVGCGPSYVEEMLEAWEFCEHRRDLAQELCSSMMANVALGPFWALFFHATVFFEQTGGDCAEGIAAMWEACLGALYRRNSVFLLKHIISYCSVIHLLLIRKIYTGDVPQLALDQEAEAVWELCGSNGHEAWLRGKALKAGSLQLSLKFMRAVMYDDFEEMIERWMATCVQELAGCQMVASLGWIVPAAANASHTELVTVHSSPVRYYLKLRCYEYDCTEEAETELCGCTFSPYEKAKVMGWWTPSTKGWKHSRCPNCKL